VAPQGRATIDHDPGVLVFWARDGDDCPGRAQYDFAISLLCLSWRPLPL